MSGDEREWEQWARNAFSAYLESTGGLTHDGKPVPAWEELGETVQRAWCAAARAARGED